MTKKELIKQVEDLANENGAEVNVKQTEKVFNAVLECIKKLTVAESKLSLSDLGTFSVKTRSERQCRNPKTGETIHVDASKTVVFKPSKAFKESVQ